MQLLGNIFDILMDIGMIWVIGLGFCHFVCAIWPGDKIKREDKMYHAVMAILYFVVAKP